MYTFALAFLRTFFGADLRAQSVPSNINFRTGAQAKVHQECFVVVVGWDVHVLLPPTHMCVCVPYCTYYTAQHT